MRECYSELGRVRGIDAMAEWTDAFVPDQVCGVMDRSPTGDWLPWTVLFPTMPGLPGDPDATSVRWTVTDYLRRSISLVRTLLETIQASIGGATTRASSQGPVGAPPSELSRLMSLLMGVGGIVGLGGLIEALRVLDEVVRLIPRFPREHVLSFHRALAKSAREQIEKLTERNDGLRRLWEVADLVLACIHGIIDCGLITDPRGFDAIDDYDCREWLMKHGASERSANSAFLRALYDLAFAYEDGDVNRPGIAAGQALRGAVRAFFTYRGAFFWKMQAGMGDVVFAPFYEVLTRRGVRFEFFHRLTNVGVVEPSRPGERPHIGRLEMDVQAKIRKGSYQPLVNVKGVPSWPAQPDWSQLVDGASLKRQKRRFESHWDQRKVSTKTLRVGDDFDFVVLAVGGGALPIVCRELIARDPRWRAQVERVKSVPTQALQLWLKEDSNALGWVGPSVNISGYVEPFDTWADMAQLIRQESFERPVKAIAYFCSVLRDGTPEETQRTDYPALRHEEVRQNAIRFLNEDISGFWPKATRRPGEFRWELLVDAERPTPVSADEAMIDSQYYRANVEPSDRYSLSLPGTLTSRISPLDGSYDNLTVAGDWTNCGFNEGCVEAAVMSGRLAAHALSQYPPLQEIIGFDHP